MKVRFNTSLMIILLLLLLPVTLFSSPFYIAINGSDNNSGTIQNPFATLNGALINIQNLRSEGKLKGNVEIKIQSGEYRLTNPVMITNDLWDGKDTLFIRGDEKDMPILKGSIQLDSFKEISENLWAVNIPEASLFGSNNIHQLFINGERATRARTPNDGEMFLTGDVEENIFDSTNVINNGLALQRLSLTDKQLEALKPAIGDFPNVIISVNHAWDRTRQYIRNVNFDNPAIHVINEPMHSWNKLDKSSQFFFENSKAFLDNPGEWFLDLHGTLFYIPYENEKINNTIAEIAVVNQLLLINGDENKQLKNIYFENISFQHTRHLFPQSGESPNQAAAIHSASIELNYATNIKFDKCEISNVSNHAIWFKKGTNHSTLSKSYLHDLGMGGVKIGDILIPDESDPFTNNIIIDNNIIQSGGYEIPTGVGVIIFHASDNTISHNDISDFKYTGVSMGWVWGYTPSVAKRNSIVYNHIHHLGWGELSDMGGVYTLGQSEGTVVSNNVIHDIYSYGYGGWGLYTDEGSTGILMENNLVYNCKSSGFHQHYGKENIIRNNIFAFNLLSQLQATRVEKHLSFTFTNNIIYFNSGDLFGRNRGVNWHLLNQSSDYNCYWDTRTKDVMFNDFSFSEWQAQGKDINSIIADPGFVNPQQFDFRFKRNNITRKIGFIPFDYTKAGVYGDPDWIKKAILNPQKIEAFNKIVNERVAHEK